MADIPIANPATALSVEMGTWVEHPLQDDRGLLRDVLGELLPPGGVVSGQKLIGDIDPSDTTGVKLMDVPS